MNPCPVNGPRLLFSHKDPWAVYEHTMEISHEGKKKAKKHLLPGLYEKGGVFLASISIDVPSKELNRKSLRV